MKNLLIVFLIALLFPMKVMAESAEIHDFEPLHREIYTEYAKAAIKEFYMQKCPDPKSQLENINFNKPIIVTADAKDEFDINIKVVGVAFPDVSIKEYWDFALLQIEDGLVTSIPYRASAVSEDMTRELYQQAKKYFIITH
ncbi:MAG: hypothetical protein WCK67_05850 [bacterium]